MVVVVGMFFIFVIGFGFVFSVVDFIIWCVIGGFGVGVVFVIVFVYIVEVFFVVI